MFQIQMLLSNHTSMSALISSPMPVSSSRYLQTQTQTDKQTDTDKHRQTDRHRQTHRYRHTHTHTNTHARMQRERERERVRRNKFYSADSTVVWLIVVISFLTSSAGSDVQPMIRIAGFIQSQCNLFHVMLHIVDVFLCRPSRKRQAWRAQCTGSVCIIYVLTELTTTTSSFSSGTATGTKRSSSSLTTWVW